MSKKQPTIQTTNFHVKIGRIVEFAASIDSLLEPKIKLIYTKYALTKC